ncbi:hypothetical protein [Clostridium cavendishii]|nr:hypothetical protein [Clostridium cavendishii]
MITIIIAASSSFGFAILMYILNHINIYTYNNILSLVTTVFFIIFVMLCLLWPNKDNSSIFTIEKVIYLYFLMSVAFMVSFWFFIENGKIYLNEIKYFIVFGLITILIAAIFLILILKILNNKILKIFFSIPIYLITILFCSLIFGFYYANINSNYNLIIKEFIEKKDIIGMIKNLIKFGMKSFYNYPSDIEFGKIPIIQFFSGKLLDLFMLGYIFSEITKNKNIKNN